MAVSFDRSVRGLAHPMRAVDFIFLAALCMQAMGIAAAAFFFWRHRRARKAGAADAGAQAGEILEILKSLKELHVAMGTTIEETVGAAAFASDQVSARVQGLSAALDDCLGRVRMVAVNGSIEASKNEECRKFQQFFEETNKAALEARAMVDRLREIPALTGRLKEDVKNLESLDDLVRRVTSGAVVFSPPAARSAKRKKNV